MSGLFLHFWEKAPGHNWKKMIDLTSKLGEITDIEHNKGRKIYPQNQVISDSIMPSIPLKHKCLSIILIWIFVSHKKLWPLKKSQKKKKNSFTFFFFGKTDMVLGKTDMVLGKKVAIFNWEWGHNSAPKDGQKIPCLSKQGIVFDRYENRFCKM